MKIITFAKEQEHKEQLEICEQTNDLKIKHLKASKQGDKNKTNFVSEHKTQNKLDQLKKF